jgi:hypothetical protein
MSLWGCHFGNANVNSCPLETLWGENVHRFYQIGGVKGLVIGALVVTLGSI